MGNLPRLPNVHARVAEDLLAAAKRKAEFEGKTLAAIIRLSLMNYVIPGVGSPQMRSVQSNGINWLAEERERLQDTGPIPAR